MNEMTDRELLDAIRRGLEKTSRRFAKQPSANDQSEQTRSPTAGRNDITTGHESSEAVREKAKL
jgi:hypothetical protein